MSDRRKAWTLLLVTAVLSGIILAQIYGVRDRPGARDVVEKPSRRDSGKDSTLPIGFEQTTPKSESILSIVGVSQPVPFDANPMTKSVAEALKNGGHSERLSASIIPLAFDPKTYAQNPEKYLNTIEPGRVWQSAQPGPTVSVASIASDAISEVLQGESIPLKVKVVPNAPVTFTSFDLGAFSNKLTSITVAADNDGIATALFTGTPGTYNDVNILAASPMTSGQVRFLVTIVVPKLRQLQTSLTSQ